MKKILLFSFLILSLPMLLNAESSSMKDSIKVSKIWDKAPHNAFPDMIRFKNEFYVSVREGNNHMPDKSGKVRIIKSKDGKKWESVGLLEKDNMDVREARLSVTPEGRIMVLLAVGIYEGKYKELYPMVSFSDQSGANFSELERTTMDLAPSLDWIWSLAWHNGIGYGVIYQIKEGGWETYLLKTSDGKHYEKVSQIDVGGNPNEATLRFDKNDRMYVLVRREADDRMGVLASSDFPYKDWSFERLKIRLGGPNFLFLDEKSLIIGSRYHMENGPKTAVFTTDLEGNIQNTLVLPSGGDTSYPGMVFHKKKLWLVYYSSHEEKSNIYLTKIPLKDLKLNLDKK